jgi:hypothetical protein
MDYEQGNIIERLLWYEADLLARCRDTVNRTRQLRETTVQLRIYCSRRNVAEPR